MMHNMGVRYYDWNVQPESYKETDGVIYNFTHPDKEYDFAIVLQHDTRNYSVYALDKMIQWALKEGYSYRLTIEENVVTAASEIAQAAEYVHTPRVAATPGEKTLKNFIATALEPVGTTLYIYGGGWDWQDEGSAVQARTLGVSADWVKFFGEHDENYTFKAQDGDDAKADPATSYYPYGEYNEYYYAGLDCSGYLGWTLYNTFETENGKDGYVGGSTKFAKRLSENGWGEWTQDVAAPDAENGYVVKPGDVISIKGHVWISLGTCGDGSVLIAHSSPSKSRTGQPGGGVQISAIGNDEDCDAYALAEKIMSEEYSEWFERYPVYLADPVVYFAIEGENAGRFTWNTDGASDGLTDPDNVQEMTPEEVLNLIFG
ncbi:MAG: hypothetical protein IKN38_09990 [Clostridia bacterium]|nr:hypothetical protein [Clostridia bacterium]